MELAKATLQEISSDNPPRELSDPIAVQFNPTTLRLQLANQVEGGNSRGRQNRQFIGSSSTQLTLDLVFDTADEGETDAPRSVREKTALIEKFVLPRVEGTNKQAPPKIRFHWGELVIDGLVDSVNIDFDHFAADGTPLRAKIGLTIKEQDSKYQFLQAGPGANSADNPPVPGEPAASAPGSSGSGGDRSALALAGESAADFAARVGLDPSAWRGLAGGLDATLSLEAGLEIGFSANLNVGIGVGIAVGVQADVSASLEASLGLSVDSNIASSNSASSSQAAGFSLSAAGGVGAAVETVKITQAADAVEQARQAFQQPATAAATAVASTTATSTTSTSSSISTASGSAGTIQRGLPEQVRTPLTNASSAQTSQSTTSAPAPPRADPRATTYAFGVPLRSTVGAAAQTRAGVMQGSISLRSSSNALSAKGGPPQTFDPTIPKWQALPQSSSTSSRDARARKPLAACGCSGRCRH